MFAKYGWSQSRLLAIGLLLVVVVVATACVPTITATPTPKPPPTITLDVSPGSQVAVGEGIAIVIKIEPYEELDWKWNVSGTGAGQLSATTGEQIVYTAGKEGIDIVVAEAKAASGATLKQTVSINIVAASHTAVPTQPTVSTTIPPTTEPSTAAVTLTNLQDGQTVPCSNIARGTYPLDLKEDIWPVVYVGGRYYPQDEGGLAAQKISGNWYQTVRFGDCQNPQRDVGQVFQLLILTANESANTEFEKYIKRGQTSGNWPGLIDLPPGIQEYLRIIVTRQ